MKNINYNTGVYRVCICLSALYAITFFFVFYHTAETNWNFHGSFTSESGLNACYETAVHSLFFPKILYSWIVGLLEVFAMLIPLTSKPNLLFVTALYSSAVFTTLALCLHFVTRTALLAVEWVVDGFKKSNSHNPAHKIDSSDTKTCY